MQTHFTTEQLAAPRIAEANAILRKCVHCGFCLSACPTYQLTGDENDSPRGRIYLLKDMLQSAKEPEALAVHHIDRCLGCLGCMPACPSAVDYMRLLDLGRQHIAENARRGLVDRVMRRSIARIVSQERLFRPFLGIGQFVAKYMPALPPPFGPLLRSARALPRVQPPAALPPRTQAAGTRRKRVMLMPGCVQQVLHPEANAAAIRLLARHGADVIVEPAQGCCGALAHHTGAIDLAQESARRNLSAWSSACKGGPIDAVVILASGCGLSLKDYGRLFPPEAPEFQAATEFSASVRDISETLAELDLVPAGNGDRPVVAYQPPCSLEHGQRIRNQPRDLLRAAGFELREITDSHLCCGSAGSYSLLQPEMSGRLKDRKVAAIHAAEVDVVATANIGCQLHLSDAAGIPVVHLVELLDWATGGPMPVRLRADLAAN